MKSNWAQGAFAPGRYTQEKNDVSTNENYP